MAKKKQTSLELTAEYVLARYSPMIIGLSKKPIAEGPKGYFTWWTYAVLPTPDNSSRKWSNNKLYMAIMMSK